MPYAGAAYASIAYAGPLPPTQTISPTGISSAEAFGVAKVNLTVNGAGHVASGESFGTAKILTGAYAKAVIALGPEAYWRLGEASGTVANDYADSHNATYIGTYALAQTGPVVTDLIDKAVLFAGTSHAEVPVSAGLAMDGLNAMSVNLWAKVTANPGTFKYMFSDNSSGGNTGYFFYTGNDGSLYFGFADQTGTLQKSNPIPGFAWDTNWHMYTATWDGSDIKMYKDGVLQNTTHLAGISNITGNLADWPRIAGFCGGGFEFPGSLDDIAIWRSALTGPQILDLFTKATSVSQIISPVGIPSGEAFGTPKIIYTAHATGIPTAETLGTPQVNYAAHAQGIPSAEVFGQGKTIYTIHPTGIPSAGAVGQPTITSNFFIRPTGIPSAEAFGQAKLTYTVHAVGISSAEAFGNAIVISGSLKPWPEPTVTIATKSCNVYIKVSSATPQVNASGIVIQQ